MAAHIGNITAALLVRVGDGEPVELGTMDLPVTLADGAGGHLGTLVVDPALFRASFARAYSAAVDQTDMAGRHREITRRLASISTLTYGDMRELVRETAEAEALTSELLARWTEVGVPLNAWLTFRYPAHPTGPQIIDILDAYTQP